MAAAEADKGQQAAGRQQKKKGVSGELALVPPLLGSSQRLLNKNHYEVYYEVGDLARLCPEVCMQQSTCDCRPALL